MIDLSIPGQMTEGELRGIEQIAKTVSPGGVVVETGSLYGLSSFTWATSVPPSVTVYCIDPWVREQWIIDLVEAKHPGCLEFSLDAFLYHTRSVKNIVSVKAYSPNGVKNWDKPVDVFFDDALHHNPYFRKNLRFWLGKMRPGGIMSGHDYCKEWPDVMSEVDRLAEELGARVQTRQWLWWFRLPNEIPSSSRSFRLPWQV
jgi:methyltransferase family protein